MGLEAADYNGVLGRPPNDRSRLFDRPLREKYPRLALVSAAELISGSTTEPAPWASGRAAFIYRMAASDGKHYALRCLREAPDPAIVARSAALNGCIRRLRAQGAALPYIVQQDFYAGALVVKRIWRPVFVVEWVDGIDIVTAARRRLQQGDRAGVRALADALARMTIALQRVGVAHGDYGGDNLLVTDTGELRLIDYDMAFVEGASGNEMLPATAAVTYTHPAYSANRAPRPLARSNDTFATVVLALSLRAAAADPSLVVGEQGQDLVITENHLRNPNERKLWERLDRCEADEEVPRLARLLRGWCREGPEASERLVEEVPDLLKMLGLEERWPLDLPPPPRITVTATDLPTPPIWQKVEPVSSRFRQGRVA